MEAEIKAIREKFGYPQEVHRMDEAIFRAGIKEVVEWLLENQYPIKVEQFESYWGNSSPIGEWQAKLKEWGL